MKSKTTKSRHCKQQNYLSRFFNLAITAIFVTNSVVGAETLGPCKVQRPVPGYGGYCKCVTDPQSGDGICKKANKWDAYHVCDGLQDPAKEIGKTICVPKNQSYGREVLCTRETNWANLATFLGTGIGTGAVTGALWGLPAGPITAGVTGFVGGSIGGVAVMIGTFGCPIRTCTATDGPEKNVVGIGIFAGQDCYHKDPVKD